MSRPLSTEELMRPDAELAARVEPSRPHPSLPEKLGPGSNVAYVSKAENDRLVAASLAIGLGQFRVRSEHEHRLDLERASRRG